MLSECLGNTVEILQRYYCYPIIAATTTAAAARRQVRPRYIFSKINITIFNNTFFFCYSFFILSDLLSTENYSLILSRYLARHQARCQANMTYKIYHEIYNKTFYILSVSAE